MSRPLQRARAKLERKLELGWQRAVFATPQREDGRVEQRVLAGPGSLPRADPRLPEALRTLFEAAEQAASEGLVKHTIVIDERTRLELDARHGHVKQRVLDEQTITKIMGGKDRPLRPDRSARLLRGIGIMNPDGTISARNAKKYKQVNHFVELCRPLWASRSPTEPLKIVDLACGNSYLSFVVLEALALENRPATLLGIDVREDVIATSRARADELGFAEQSRFIAASLEELSPTRLRAELGGDPQIAISLHACDTATDAALALAIACDVEAILCVPCCQAELARQLASLSPTQRERTAMIPAALEHGLLRRTLGEVLTDALRVELLEACGYAVTTLEFVGSEHTPKNLLLRALRGPSRRAAKWRLEPVRSRCERLGVDPALLRTLTRLQSDLGDDHEVV